MKKKLVKMAKKLAKDIAVAIAKSAAIVAIKEWMIIPLMKKLKKIYDRNPEMERRFGL